MGLWSREQKLRDGSPVSVLGGEGDTTERDAHQSVLSGWEMGSQARGGARPREAAGGGGWSMDRLANCLLPGSLSETITTAVGDTEEGLPRGTTPQQPQAGQAQRAGAGHTLSTHDPWKTLRKPHLLPTRKLRTASAMNSK